MVFDTQQNPFQRLVKSATDLFQERFHRSPQLIVAAPGRVNLIGEHIDYNDGYVLPMAIERYTVVAADLKSNSTDHKNTSNDFANVASIYSAQQNQSIELKLNESSGFRPGDWGCYIEGVVDGFLQRRGVIPGFDAVINTNVPVGGGLSSSAALEVAFATLLEAFTGIDLSQKEKAFLCQKAEHQFAGMPCGIMDQFASVFGKKGQVLLIDCQAEEVSYVPFVDHQLAILVTNSNVRHQLADGQYALRKQQCESALEKIGLDSWRSVTQKKLDQKKKILTDIELKRAKHVIGETLRTRQAANAFAESDWHWLGQLMHASHVSLKNDYEVSCPELDHLVQIAKEIGPGGGVYGSRMTGGGFGGCTVSLVKTSMIEEIANRLEKSYLERTGIQCDSFSSRPADGAFEVLNYLD